MCLLSKHSCWLVEKKQLFFSLKLTLSFLLNLPSYIFIIFWKQTILECASVQFKTRHYYPVVG